MQFRGHPPLSLDEVSALLDLCSRASDTILRFYRNQGSAGLLRNKADKTPLTEADLASHRMLSRGLRSLAPELPLLSEESTPEEIADRHRWNAFWMVDPLDGTREFLERTGEFTINIALIRDQRPILGLVFEPMAQTANLGVVGEGAWRLQRSGDIWRSVPLRTRALAPEALVVLASRRHRNRRLDSCLSYLERSHNLERRNSGSALKFCDLAAGRGDCYPRFSPCSEWDVAAGDALVTAAGGAVLGMDGQPLNYNARESLLSPHFIAVGDSDASLWKGVIECME